MNNKRKELMIPTRVSENKYKRTTRDPIVCETWSIAAGKGKRASDMHYSPKYGLRCVFVGPRGGIYFVAFDSNYVGHMRTSKKQTVWRRIYLEDRFSIKTRLKNFRRKLWTKFQTNSEEVCQTMKCNMDYNACHESLLCPFEKSCEEHHDIIM